LGERKEKKRLCGDAVFVVWK